MAGHEESRGFVVRIKGADYYVVDGGAEVLCSVRGKFRTLGGPGDIMPVVGDNVIYRPRKDYDSRGLTGLIISVEPRRSIFARGDSRGGRELKILGANIDKVFLVHAVRQPELNLRLLDRMIVAAERSGIKPVISINKIDIEHDGAALERSLEPYAAAGYEVILSSAVDRRGIEDIRAGLTGRRSMMAGPSGAGKTTLLSILEPGLEIRTAGVSEKTGKGRHTTTHFELHPLQCGGYLGDTPGIREFGIWGVSKQTLRDYFVDFSPWQPACRFASCTHSHEPGCRVKEAVDNGDISAQRYESYLRILEDLPDRLE